MTQLATQMHRTHRTHKERRFSHAGSVCRFAAIFMATLFVAGICAGMCGCSGTQSTKSSTISTSITQASKEIVPAYEHYDTAAFYEICDTLTAQSSGSAASEALATFDKAIDQLGYLSTLNSVIYITYCEDTTNKDNETEYTYTTNAYVECADRLSIAAHALATSAHADAFRARLSNDDAFNSFAAYEAMSQEEKNLTERETELVTNYYDIVSDTSSYTYEYDGRNYTLDALNSEMALVMLGEEGYREVYSGCIKKMNEAAGAVFTELVSVRTQIAQLNGYEDYCEYADSEVYNRDYSEADLDIFRNSVQAFTASGQMADSYILAAAIPDYDVKVGTLLDNVNSTVTCVSPYASDSLSYLRENGLSSIGPDDNRMDSGFTTPLYSPAQSAFIYNCTSGTVLDLSSTIHELGHFTHMTRSGDGSIYNILNSECLDVSEIHSTGLELLASRQLSAAMPDAEAQTTSAWLAASALESISDGCIYDEWQRIVYRNPTMNLDEINEAFRNTLAAYGMDTSNASTYSWVSISHNFDAPLYYVSYATSYFASLQLWDMAGTDASAAAAIWEKAVDCTPGTGYVELCESAGLSNIADANAVTRVLTSVNTQITAQIAALSSTDA